MLHIAYAPVSGTTGHEAGRRLLAELYRSVTGEPLPPIAAADRGKPYFPTAPLHFSITHTQHHTFCALSDTPVGIDAEEIGRQINLKLAEKILSPSEKEQFDAAEDPRMALLTFWVLKEAAGKCSGAGINGYPNHTQFSLDDPRVTIEHGCLLAVIQEENHAL